MNTSNPIIRTGRFILNPLTQNDAPLFAEIGSDPDVVKQLICDWSTPTKRLEIAKSFIDSGQEYGVWGVFDEKGIFGSPAQMIGFCAADAPLHLHGKGPEIYYALNRISWGQGVGTEITQAVVKYLFEELRVNAVEALIFAGLNPASVKILTKIGMSLVGRYPLAEYVGEECGPTIEYELWRVRNATPENALLNLKEAALKIGQFVGEKFVSQETMFNRFQQAVAANNHLKLEDSQVLTDLINMSLQAGRVERGLLHYRVEKDQ